MATIGVKGLIIVKMIGAVSGPFSYAFLMHACLFLEIMFVCTLAWLAIISDSCASIDVLPINFLVFTA